MDGGPRERARVWNFGDIADSLEKALPPDGPALIHGDRTISWGDFSRRSNAFARRLGELGAHTGDRVAFYLRNEPAYLEGLFGCFKGRFVHANVNFRYTDDELYYILDDSDAAIVLYGAEFRPHVEALAGRLDKVKAFVQVGGEARPDGVLDYEDVVCSGSGEPLGIERSSDDLFFLYTGGTTGMPKGVMWRAEDHWASLGSGAKHPGATDQPPPDPEAHAAQMARAIEGGLRFKEIPASPLMHGAALLQSIWTITSGGCVVTLERPSFDVEELLDTIDRHRVMSISIVGDAFARPMLEALRAQPGRWKLDSLEYIFSSGAIWSREVKRGLLVQQPRLTLWDAFGSSESGEVGTMITTAGEEVETARFRLSPRCKVFNEQLREVVPGSGEPGFVARTGPLPLGYHKDPEKTAQSFRTIDGVRYVIPGDWCIVEADGNLTLLGRGSTCINTAGEKVYPEEVEVALKSHPDVEDALVVGLPDERWGQAVTGVLELRDDASLDEDALRQHLRAALAGYKVPKRFVTVGSMFRAPNGKPDYASALAHAREQLSSHGHSSQRRGALEGSR